MVFVSNARRSAYSGRARVAHGGVRIELREAPLEARLRLRAQVIVERDAGRRREQRKVVLAERDRQVAALRDRDAVRERLGQVGELRRHLRLRDEILLRREAPRPPRVGEHVTFGDAHARFVRAEILAPEELHRMRRDDRQRELAGERDRGADQRVVVGAARALHLEEVAIRERRAPTRARTCAAPIALPCRSAWPTSPSRAPESAISPSVPSANQARRISARPRCWFVRYARVSQSQSLR